MAREKKSVHKVVMTEGKRQIIANLLSEYDIKSANDIQEALKDLLGGTIKEMMETEMDSHLGYSKSERSDKADYRNGYKSKTISGNFGELEISQVLQALVQKLLKLCLMNIITLIIFMLILIN